VVASGEQVTAGLMAVVLSEMGIPSRSFQGWQVPIKTDDAHGAARIMEIDPTELEKRFADGVVPVITGFQGVAPSGRVTTLGSYIRRESANLHTLEMWSAILMSCLLGLACFGVGLSWATMVIEAS